MVEQFVSEKTCSMLPETFKHFKNFPFIIIYKGKRGESKNKSS